MTPTWSQRVRDRAHGRCQARRHDPRCRLVGDHAHHVVFRSHAPKFTHYTVLANGVWLSLVCHDLAHKTHNGNLFAEHKRLAVSEINAKIAEIEPLKPELKVKPFEDAA